MEDKIQSFEDLNVWKKGHSLVLKIYDITKQFPDSEQYTLTDQIKRAATSVVAAIAEGFQNRDKEEKLRLYNEALSALNDTHYLLILSRDLKYYDTYELIYCAQEVNKMLHGLIRSMNSRPSSEHHPHKYKPSAQKSESSFDELL